MNILIISEYFPPDQVGASTRTKIIVKELIKYHNVTLITSTPHYPKPEKVNQAFHTPIKIYQGKSLKIIRVWMPEINMDTTIGRVFDYSYFTLFFMLALPFVSEKPDFIWGSAPNVFCGFTAKIAHSFLGGVPIVHIDDIWPEGPIDFGFLRPKLLQKLSELLAKLSLSNIRIITTISDSISRYYKKKYKIPQIYTIPVGIEEKRLKKLIQLKRDMKGQKRSNNKTLFMYSGKLGPGYDFDLMIKAFGFLQNNENEGIKLIIRGTGPLESRIKRSIEENNVKNIVLENTYLALKELNRKLISADAFILPMQDSILSKTALPTKLFEYMGIGKPVLVFGTGEPKMLVEKANAGLVSSDRDPKKLADLIKKFIDLEDHWDNWGENGQKFIKKYYSSNIIVLQANKMFKELKQKF
jgi:glycosyltransferase involved in cell wall biosynthesis